MEQAFSRYERLVAVAAVGLWAVGCGAREGGTGEALQLGTLGQPVVVATDDPPSQQLKDDVSAVLRERQNLPQTHPELLPAQLDPDLRVTQAADVWVTFFSESMGQRSALGYFTYPEGQPPTAPPSLTVRRANIIFANASASGSGGTLVQGNRRFLGRFPAGSRVGFFLIANACGSDTGCTADNIDYTRPTYYTLDAFNPELNPSKRRHVVLVSHAGERRHVLGFEALNREGTSPVSDDDFEDLVFVVSYNPPTAVEPSGPGVDPDSSCQAMKTRFPTAASGVYRLDPCGTGVVSDYYCDMTTPGADGRVGGWTVAGWQAASATTSLGVEDRGTVGGTAWSKSLSCISFTEAMVFNRTYNESFLQVLPRLQPGVRGAPFALGTAGQSVVQGTLGPYALGQNITMGCVGYDYAGAVSPEWACVTDWTMNGKAKGHIADFAVEYNCNPAIYTARWAWASDSTCRHVGVNYTWGMAVR